MDVASGKAIFIRSWRGIAPGPDALPSDTAERYAAAGFSWACPLALSGTSGLAGFRVSNRDPAHWRAMRDVGVNLWALWALPGVGSRQVLERDAAELCAFAAGVGCIGIVPDPEAEWLGKPGPATAFAEILAEAADRAGLLLAITSYGHPRSMPSFPWAAFASMPPILALAQTYDRNMDFRASYFRDGLAQWLAKGYAPVYPCAGLYNHRDGRAKTAQEVARHLALIPGADGVCVWPTAAIGEDVWRVLADWTPATAAAVSRRRGGRGLIAAAGLGLAAAAMAKWGRP